MPYILLIDGFLNTLLLLVLALLFLLFGYSVQHKLPGPKTIDGTGLFHALLGGAAIVFWSMLTLGVFGLLNSTTLGLLIALQIAVPIIYRDAMWNLLKQDVCAIIRTYRTAWKDSPAKIGVAAMSFVTLLILGMGYLVVLLPTTETDSISSYLASAKLFWQHHGIINVGYVIGNMAKGGFMPLLYGYALSSGILSQLLCYLAIFSGTVFFHYCLTRQFGLTAASLCILVLIGMGYHIEYSFGPAKIDNFSLAYAIVSLIAWHQYATTGALRYLLINAFSAGYLASISYLNLDMGLIYFGLMALVIFKQKNSRPQQWKQLVTWSVIAFFAVAPSYLYNWIVFGNPLYPHVANVFGHGVGYDDLDSGGAFYRYMNELYDQWGVHSLKEALLLPIAMWQNPDAFQTRKEHIFIVFWLISIAGYFWLLLKPSPKMPRYTTVGIGIAFVLLYVIWTQQYILRYFSPALPFIFWIGAGIIERIPNSYRRSHLFNLLLVALAITSYSYSKPIINKARASMDNLVHAQSFRVFLAERFPYSSTDNTGPLPMGYIIAELRGWLPANSKVLYFLPGAFYLGDQVTSFNATSGVMMPSPYGLPKPLHHYKNVNELMQDLSNNRFTHIIIHPSFLSVSPAEKPITDGLLKLKPVFEVEGTHVIPVKL